MAIYLYVLQLHDAFGMIGQKGLEAPCRDYDFESKGSKIQCQELDNGSTTRVSSFESAKPWFWVSVVMVKT